MKDNRVVAERLSRASLVRGVLLALALAPLALIAYQGTFSRLVRDDFCHIHIGQTFGPWGGVLHWRNVWNGSYSDYFVHGLAAPLATTMPSVFPLIVVALWLISLSWLMSIVLRKMGAGSGPGKAVAVIVAALVCIAAINAFYTPQSFLWYAASARYVLPLAILTFCCAFILETAIRPQSNSRRYLAADGRRGGSSSSMPGFPKCISCSS